MMIKDGKTCYQHSQKVDGYFANLYFYVSIYGTLKKIMIKNNRYWEYGVFVLCKKTYLSQKKACNDKQKNWQSHLAWNKITQLGFCQSVNFFKGEIIHVQKEKGKMIEGCYGPKPEELKQLRRIQARWACKNTAELVRYAIECSGNWNWNWNWLRRSVQSSRGHY